MCSECNVCGWNAVVDHGSEFSRKCLVCGHGSNAFDNPVPPTPKWRREPPGKPGWYRVLDNDCLTVQFVFGGWSADMMDFSTALFDHRPIEFLPVPGGEE